jgi:hypothetical protein
MTLSGLRDFLDDPKRREIIHLDCTELKDPRSVADTTDTDPGKSEVKKLEKPPAGVQKCYACREEGHLSPNCPHPEKKKAFYDFQKAKDVHLKALSVNKLEVAFGSD